MDWVTLIGAVAAAASAFGVSKIAAGLWRAMSGGQDRDISAAERFQSIYQIEFDRLDHDATEARHRAASLQVRVDELEMALREATHAIREFEARVEEFDRRLDRMRVRERVMADALAELGKPVNGWVDEAIEAIEQWDGRD